MCFNIYLTNLKNCFKVKILLLKLKKHWNDTYTFQSMYSFMWWVLFGSRNNIETIFHVILSFVAFVLEKTADLQR